MRIFSVQFVSLIGCLNLVRCANNDIVVDLTGLPREAAKLEIRTRFEGKEPKISIVEPATPQFVMSPQEGSDGHLDVEVTAFGKTECTVSKGRAELVWTRGKMRPTHVQLEQKSSEFCPLKITFSGEGRVYSSPLGVDCTTSCGPVMVPAGQPIQLSVNPFPKDYLVDFSGACSSKHTETEHRCTFLPVAASEVVVDVYPKVCPQGDLVRCFAEATGVPTKAKDKAIYSVWSDSLNRAWMASETGSVLQPQSSGGWALQTISQSVEQSKKVNSSPLHSIWGADEKNVWVAGDHGFLAKWDGSAWQPVGNVATVEQDLRAVFGSDANNVWIAGTKAALVAWDGRIWSPQNIPIAETELRAGWTSSPSRVWVVGFGGVVAHKVNGEFFAEKVNDGIDFECIWGDTSGRVWAVGNRNQNVATQGYMGVVYAYDGTAWTMVFQSATTRFHAIWGLSAKDLWVAGDGGKVFRFDGAWRGHSLPASDLLAAFGTGSGNVWSVSSTGQVFHYMPR